MMAVLLGRTMLGGLPRLGARWSSTNHLRNVGIIAHVDAGKTTTSEVMLYLAGYVARAGTVDRGDTQLDFMEQERERGITIANAAITFGWPLPKPGLSTYQINYIDTPGHVDFGNEVERALAVLDGAIVVLDVSAGVEAQTQTVWRQADRHAVPRIAYINKMDKPSASLAACLESMRRKLGVTPLVLQQAVGEGRHFTGVLDLVTMQALLWRRGEAGVAGAREMTVLTEEEVKTTMFDSWQAAVEARSALVEEVANFDDQLAEMVITQESTEASVHELKEAVRRVALRPDSGALVTLLGSSKAQVGIQPLLDAVVDYCPAPEDRQHRGDLARFGNNFSGLVYKVAHDRNKGALCYVRVYTGTVRAKGSVYNATQGLTEKMGDLLVAMAADNCSVQILEAGNYGVISGLKETATGDTLVASAAAARAMEDPLLPGPAVPEPVVFSCLEPPSAAQARQLERGLAALCREDPSLRVREDADTGQTVVGAVGELQLEILRDRLLKEYKVEVEAQRVDIAYREQLAGGWRGLDEFKRSIGGRDQRVELELEVRPCEEGEEGAVVGPGRETQESLAKLRRPERATRLLLQGLRAGLARGPLLGCQVGGARILLHSAAVGPGTEDTMVLAGAEQLARAAVRAAGVRLAEPVMRVEVVTEPELRSHVLQDILRRRGQVEEDQWGRDSQNTVRALAPLAELLGYSARLRRELSGEASISMELAEYRLMTAGEEANAVESVTGFAPRSD